MSQTGCRTTGWCAFLTLLADLTNKISHSSYWPPLRGRVTSGFLRQALETSFRISFRIGFVSADNHLPRSIKDVVGVRCVYLFVILLVLEGPLSSPRPWLKCLFVAGALTVLSQQDLIIRAY